MRLRLTRRAMARAAAAGLAVGLCAIAGLSVLSNVVTARTTQQVRAINQVSNMWGEVFVKLSAEDAALREFLATGGTEYRRGPLTAVVHSADAALARLAQAGDAEADAVRIIADEYRDYTDTILDVLDMTARGESIHGYGELAALAFAPLRDHVVANFNRKQRELNDYMARVDRRNAELGRLSAGVIAADLLLLLFCTFALIGYQRRAERAAAVSQYDATHDSLTGLANRVLLGEQLRTGIANAARTGEPISLMLIDLNRFKEVNDSLGHHCGDELLRSVAERLSDAARGGDTVARLGGDEFAVVLPRVGSPETAVEVARRLLAALCQPLMLDGVLVDVDASVGVATYPADGTTAEQLLQRADVAMYTAKRGSLGVMRYDSADDGHSRGRLAMHSELRQGIERHELVLHYQPKVDVRTGRVVGVEALARWQHPERGLLGPAEFIPIAEEGGLIEPLTDEVLTMALRQAGQWLQAGLRLPVAVNIGAQCLANAGLPDQVATTLTRYRVPAELLTLELTESALIAQPDLAVAVLDRLRDFGVNMSVDDFGTGYSSLTRLRDMSLDELKIDRQFVHTMCEDPRNETIVRSVIDLARNLHLRVVAEGVEDERTLTTLAGLGCDLAQGYHISRPVPAAELMTWLSQRDVAATGPAHNDQYTASVR